MALSKTSATVSCRTTAHNRGKKRVRITGSQDSNRSTCDCTYLGLPASRCASRGTKNLRRYCLLDISSSLSGGVGHLRTWTEPPSYAVSDIVSRSQWVDLPRMVVHGAYVSRSSVAHCSSAAGSRPPNLDQEHKGQGVMIQLSSL